MYCKNCGEQISDGTNICPQCGAFAGNGQNYCGNCGNAVSPDAAYCTSCGTPLKTAGSPAKASSNISRNIKPRDIVTSIIFALLTCGIYNIYWFIVLTDEVNHLTGRHNDMSGGLAFVLDLLTCGIYGYIWAYQIGQKVDQLSGAENGSSGIIYIVMTALGLDIVTHALIQDTVNKSLANN